MSSYYIVAGCLEIDKLGTVVRLSLFGTIVPIDKLTMVVLQILQESYEGWPCC